MGGGTYISLAKESFTVSIPGLAYGTLRRAIPKVSASTRDSKGKACPTVPPLEPEMYNLYIVDLRKYIKKQCLICMIYAHTHSLQKPASPYHSLLALPLLSPFPHHRQHSLPFLQMNTETRPNSSYLSYLQHPYPSSPPCLLPSLNCQPNQFLITGYQLLVS